MVKDYGRYRRTLLSPIARLMVRHEARMLRQLQGWRHAPALLGTLGGLALGMEFIPGDTLSASTVVGQEVFQQLQQALRRLHAFGITHNDLHGTNVVVSAGVPVLIDFTSAWRFRAGCGAARWRVSCSAATWPIFRKCASALPASHRLPTNRPAVPNRAGCRRFAAAGSGYIGV